MRAPATNPSRDSRRANPPAVVGHCGLTHYASTVGRDSFERLDRPAGERVWIRGRSREPSQWGNCQMYTALMIGVVGLLLWGICARIELQADAHDTLFDAQYKAREKMTGAERASRQQERSLAHRSVRLFKDLGIGLTAIGFGGAVFIYGLS